MGEQKAYDANVDIPPGVLAGPPGETAATLFEAGFSCAESIIWTLATRLGADIADPQRLGAALGGGIARRGLVCGCLSGCAVAFGLLAGRVSRHDDERKEQIYAALERVLAEVERRHGSLDCRRLTGLDFSKPEDRETFERGVKQDVCIPILELTTELAVAELEALGVGRRP